MRVRPRPGTLTIVTLHRFLPAEQRALYPWPQLAVTPTAFQRMLAFFGTYFRVLPLSEALLAADAGREKKPLLAITVDDGQWDNFHYARPLLKRAGLRATFYIPTDAVDEQKLLWPDRLGFALAAGGLDFAALKEFLGPAAADSAAASQLVEDVKRLSADHHAAVMRIVDEHLRAVDIPSWGRLMTWDEIRTLAADGHEIGGHSRSHPILPAVSDADLDDEAQGCMDRLRTELGHASKSGAGVLSFAYPNGDTDDRVCAAVKRAGFENAVTCAEAPAQLDGDRFRLGRFDLQEELNQGLLGRIDVPTLAYRLRPR